MADSNLNDLFTALKMFQQGAQQLAVQRAITGANEQVHQIKTQEADEAAQMQQLRGVANNLTLQLSGLGMDAAHIEQAGKAIAPPQPQPIQSAFQGLIAGVNDPAQIREIAQKYIDDGQEHKALLQNAKNQAAQEKEAPKLYTKALKEFGDKKHIKESLVGLNTLNQVPDELGKNNINYVFGLKTLIKKVESRITEEDYDLATPNKDVASRAKRLAAAISTGKPIQADVEAIEALTSVLKRKTEDDIDNYARGYAKVRAKQLGADPDSLYNDLVTENLPSRMQGSNLPKSQVGAVAPQVPGQPASMIPPPALPFFTPRKK